MIAHWHGETIGSTVTLCSFSNFMTIFSNFMTSDTVPTLWRRPFAIAADRHGQAPGLCDRQHLFPHGVVWSGALQRWLPAEWDDRSLEQQCGVNGGQYTTGAGQFVDPGAF